MLEKRGYLYAAGVATGIIMAILSILTSVQMVDYVTRGGSFLLLIIVSLLVGLAIGILIAFLVSSLDN